MGYVPAAVEEGGGNVEPPPKAKKSAKAKSTEHSTSQEEEDGEVAEPASSKDKNKPKGKAADEQELEIPAELLAKAQCANLTVNLKKLLARDDIKKARIAPGSVLRALEESKGLVIKARKLLLEA